MTLITKRLSAVWTHLDQPLILPHLRYRQVANRHRLLRSAIPHRQRWRHDLLFARDHGAPDVALLRSAKLMNRMARKARNGRAIGDGRVAKTPRALSVDRRDQSADSTIKMHAVTAQAIVH